MARSKRLKSTFRIASMPRSSTCRWPSRGSKASRFRTTRWRAACREIAPWVRFELFIPGADAPAGEARIEVQIDAAPLPKMVQLDDAAKETSSWFQQFSRPRETPVAASHETWAMNLPKAELDRLLGVLATPGSVVTSKQAQTAGASLTTHFNGHHYHGTCRPVPQLDELMRRVRDQGRLVAYSHPLSASTQQLEALVVCGDVPRAAAARDQRCNRSLSPASSNSTGRHGPGRPKRRPRGSIAGRQRSDHTALACVSNLEFGISFELRASIFC